MILVKHAFGKPIRVRYVPEVAAEPQTAYSLTSARLYSGYPSDAQRAAADGSELQNVTSWTATNNELSGPAEYVIEFTAVADPNPTSSTEYEKYYVALNYKLDSTGTDVRDVEQLFIYRPNGATGKIRVSAQSVYDLDSSIEDVAPSIAWTNTKIAAALDELLLMLKARGYDPRLIFDFEELTPAATRFAAAYCCFSLVSLDAQTWMEKGKFWYEQGTKFLDSTKFGFDASGTGTPDPEETIETGTVTPLR